MPKSQSQTDAEILSSAKSADVILPESSSLIHRRHIRSVHPCQCRCFSCRELRFQHFSAKAERERKAELDWYQED